jgi:hypothetical protein
MACPPATKPDEVRIFRQRTPELIHETSRHRYADKLGRIRWGVVGLEIGSGDQVTPNPVTGEVPPGDFYAMTESFFHPVTHIRTTNITLSFQSIEPLLDEDLPLAQKLLLRYNVAISLVHELCVSHYACTLLILGA